MPDADPVLGLAQLGVDLEPTRLEVSSARRSTLHRTDEPVALLAGVLASRLGEFAAQDLVDVGETGEVTLVEPDLEHVGHDPPSLHVDRSLLVHLADETASELDRSDAVAGTASEHALDDTL